MSLREWKCKIPSLEQYALLHRPEQPSITYLILALSFSMRLNFILNAPAQLESGGYLCCLCVKGFPFVIVFAERGFPKVADWLTVQWSFVVKSWALAEDVELWFGGSLKRVQSELGFAANLEHETQRKVKKLK